MSRHEKRLEADRIVALRATGAKCREVAQAVGCNEYRVWYVLRSRGLTPPRDRGMRLISEIFGKDGTDGRA